MIEMSNVRHIDNLARESLLYDFYGGLLSKRQGQIVEMYTQDNLSLGEISEELDISRQAVHDALNKGRRSLEQYEDKLGLVSRFLRTEKAISDIDQRILRLIDRVDRKEEGRKLLVDELNRIKSIIDGLEE